MNFRRIISALLWISLILFYGCTEPDFDLQKSTVPHAAYRLQGRMILVRELEDPHAIDNIIEAYENLRLANPSTPVIDIKPNHVYLRFLPENDEEQALLRNDTTLILYDHPLNWETTDQGDGASEGDPVYSPDRWLYCVVPAGKILPRVSHEIIYDVFIPPSGEYTGKSTSADLSTFYDALILESARLTGNLDEDTSIYQSKGLFSGRWTPKGRIRVWDDLLGQYIPLKHVNVHARWFTHIETGLTDENGFFQTGSFRNKVNYSIKWENTLFTIRNGLLLQAWYNGPKKKGDWILDIRGGKSMMFATIHRAAYKHFYGDNLGMWRPALKTGGRTKICYRDGNGTGEFLGDWSGGGILPDIQIWGKSNGNYKKTNKIFGNTAHELGHQSHSQFLGNIKYWQTSKIIRESWADAVEWAIANDEYHRLGQQYGNGVLINYNHQYNTHNRWPFVDDKDYSPIFIDLMDRINQRIAIGPGYPNDMISGYSLSYINNYMLMNASGISSLQDEVTRHKLDGIDDFRIEELFSMYK